MKKLIPLYALTSSLTLFSLPQEMQVVSGEAQIEVSPGKLGITTSHQTILNWKQFSIGEQERVQFHQPSAASSVLNRIKGGHASHILGQLHSNGKVYLINPSGIVIGQKGVIQTAGFIASTLDVSDGDFLAAKEMLFSGDSREALINYGTIEALDGDVSLIGRIVDNQGIVKAPKGKVSLLAAQEVLLRPHNTALITIRPNSESTISHEGRIEALAAELQAEGQAYAFGINLNGSIQALNAVEQNGKIYLKADAISTTGTTTIQSDVIEITTTDRPLINLGTLEASKSIAIDATKMMNTGTLLAGDRISIRTSGGYVETVQGKISASEISILSGTSFYTSGTYSSTGPISIDANEIILSNAHFTGEKISIGTVAQSVHLMGNTHLKTAPNGEIKVWSSEKTVCYGLLESPQGFIEVSSKGDLYCKAHLQATTVLLDPSNIIISDAPIGVYPQYQFIDPHGSVVSGFGYQTVPLPSGNVVVIKANDNFVTTAAGAAYLYDGVTAALISILTGSHAIDQVGSRGATVLTNGNYIINTDTWDNARGAVTWASGTLGISGTVTTANSLVGAGSADRVATEVTPLTNGNYVVISVDWNGARGAATWCNGLGGTVGTVSSLNSLVGTNINDRIGVGTTLALSNGNYVVQGNGTGLRGVVAWGNGLGGTVGAVTALNSLLGSTAGDQVGFAGVSEVAGSNYVVQSPNWDNGVATNAGAVTWGNGLGGTVGTVTAANSLVGTTANDQVGLSLRVLTNGNYVVQSPNWDNGVTTNAGAVTWGNGLGGTVGAVTAANSLVGTTAGDQVGSGLTVLISGNYVVQSPNWDNGVVINAGAATWGNGLGGTVGAVTAANSLVGTAAGDQVSSGGVNGLLLDYYVVISPDWNNSTGAVTWGNGPLTGAVSGANSLVGSASGDSVGSGGATVLTNGNYVVISPLWNSSQGAVTWGNGAALTAGAVTSLNSLVGSTASSSPIATSVKALIGGNFVVISPSWNGNRGAVTFGDGTVMITGTVTSANSLIGSSLNDQVGSGGVTSLTDGNYVVSSPNWNDGVIANVGAATWGDGSVGVVGTVTTTNSLTGSTANDQVSSGGIAALTNNNYVVASPNWDDGVTANVGAATWGDGAVGITGTVTTTNSLYGTTADDQVSSAGIAALSNDNYVVASPNWDDGVTANVGAATWGDGATGTTGAVTTVNSLYGTTASDQVSSAGIAALSNGNYVVASPNWDDGVTANVGAATWGDGTTGTTGAVTLANSLHGTTSGDQVSSGGVKALLVNGNYVVISPSWDGVGAATWGDGTAGTTGAVTIANSLYGIFGSEQIGSGGVTALTNGNYVVISPNWDSDGSFSLVGAATWGNGTTGTTGLVSVSNSLVGSSVFDQIGSSGVTALSNGHYVVASPNWTNGSTSFVGAATWGNGTTGITGTVTTANSLYGATANDQVSSAGVVALTNGNYVVLSPEWNDSSVTTVGAATWGNGTTGITGTVTTANSLTGSDSGDRVGSGGAIALSNNHYVVASPDWNGIGAITWGDGTTGTTGTVTTANSIVGEFSGDQIGSGGMAALEASDNYVIASPNWHSSLLGIPIGAATWADGSAAASGVVTSANSLVGQVGDQVGNNGVPALTNGNYVVLSSRWNMVGAATFGEGATAGVRLVGTVTTLNSLTGTTAGDQIGIGGAEPLGNGNYVVISYNWNDGSTTHVGAVTWGDGTVGTTGTVSSTNSLIGTQTNDSIGSNGVLPLSTDHYVVNSPLWDNGSLAGAGAATWGDGTVGVSGAVTPQNSIAGLTDNTNMQLRPIVEDTVSGTFIVTFLTENAGKGVVRVGIYFPNQMTFDRAEAQDMSITPLFLTTTLNTGASVVLQASNDLTLLSDIVSSTGSLTLQAGRSITLNGSIVTGNAPLTVIANDLLSSGVVDAYRLPGAATLSVGSGVTLNTGTADMTLSLLDGAGKTSTASGNLTIGNNATLLCSGAGSMNLLAQQNNIVLGSGALLQTVDGNLQLTAGVSITGSGPVTLRTTGTGQLILLSDNLFPTSPGFGAGAVVLPQATLTTGGGKLLIYTSNRDFNTMPTTINGVPFIPGPLFVNSVTEQWFVYYPSSSGIPFTIFYKTGTPPPTPAVMHGVITAVVESFRNWNNPWFNDIYFVADPYPPYLTPKDLRLRIPSLIRISTEFESVKWDNKARSEGE